jgi:hypothetical protein
MLLARTFSWIVYILPSTWQISAQRMCDSGTTIIYPNMRCTKRCRRKTSTRVKCWKILLGSHRRVIIKIGYLRGTQPIDTMRTSRVVERGRDRKWSPLWRRNSSTDGSVAVAATFRPGSRQCREGTPTDTRITPICRPRHILVSESQSYPGIVNQVVATCAKSEAAMFIIKTDIIIPFKQ